MSTGNTETLQKINHLFTFIKNTIPEEPDQQWYKDLLQGLLEITQKVSDPMTASHFKKHWRQVKDKITVVVVDEKMCQFHVQKIEQRLNSF